jgi:hypothetical protein
LATFLPSLNSANHTPFCPLLSNSTYLESDTTCSATNVVTGFFLLDTCIPFSTPNFATISVSGDSYIGKNVCPSLCVFDTLVIDICIGNVLHTSSITQKLLSPRDFSAGASVTFREYNDAKCSGSATKTNLVKIGSCVSTGGKYRSAAKLSISGSAPVSTPVSTPTIVVSPSPTSSPTSGGLTGYLFSAKYLDASCTTFGSVEIYLLDACLVSYSQSELIYVKASSTSTAFRYDYYTDDKCSTLKTAGTPAAISVCSSGSNTFVQPSMDIPIARPYATQR